MSKGIMEVYCCLVKAQGAGFSLIKEKQHTHVYFMLSPSLLLKQHEPQPCKAKLLQLHL